MRAQPRSSSSRDPSQAHYSPLRLSHPLGHEVRTRHGEERALGLGRDRLGEERFTCSGRSVEEDTAPRGTLAGEELGKLDGKNDRLLERLLGLLETGDIVPTDVGRLGDNRARQRAAQLLDLGVVPVLAAFTDTRAASLGPPAARRADFCSRSLLLALRNVLLELLGAVQVLGELFADEFLELVVLLVCRLGGWVMGGVERGRHTFHCLLSAKRRRRSSLPS